MLRFVKVWGVINLFLGIDVGSVSTDAVLINSDGEIVAEAVVNSGFNHQKAISSAMENVCGLAEIKRADISKTVGTGYGRKNIPFADKVVTEISCHAKGIYQLYPQVKFLIDVGGQDLKVIEVGENGSVRNFVMNDKCAAGTGRFLDVMANALGIHVNELGSLSEKAKKAKPISSTCTVFAESEVISLIAQGIPAEEIVAGIHKSVAARVLSMGHSLGIGGKVAMSGGVAMNSGVVKALEEELDDIFIPAKPQIIGAYGAAVYARSLEA